MNSLNGRPPGHGLATDADVLAMVAHATARTVTALLADRIRSLRDCVREQEQLFAKLPDRPDFNAINDNFRVTQVLLSQVEADLKDFVASAPRPASDRAA